MHHPIDIRTRAPRNDVIVARCSCGQQFTLEQWRRLPRVGRQSDFNGGWLELRNCSCASTCSRPVVPLGMPVDHVPLGPRETALVYVLSFILGAGVAAVWIILLLGVW